MYSTMIEMIHKSPDNTCIQKEYVASFYLELNRLSLSNKTKIQDNYYLFSTLQEMLLTWL